MSLLCTINGSSYNIKDGTLHISDAIAQRSTASFTVEDAAGTTDFQFGQPVVIADSTNGNLFVGFVNAADNDKLYPNPNKEVAVTCMDNHYLADKRRCVVDYTNMAAGDITIDLLSRYLAGEGVTAGYAYRHDTLDTDFSQATIGLDSFVGRTVSNGLGTGSDGQSWTTVSTSSAAALSVSSSEGRIAQAGSWTTCQYGTKTTADGEVSMRFKLGTSGDYFCLDLRATNYAGGTFYRAVANVGTLSLERHITGTTTVLSTTSLAIPAGAFWWLRFRVQGTNLYTKSWADGATEPTAWTLSTTDTQISAAAPFGLLALATSGTAVQFDTYSVVSLNLNVGSNGSNVTSTLNVGDGDLELSTQGSTTTKTFQSNSDWSTGATLTNIDANGNQINLHAYNALKYTGTNAGTGSTNCYAYWEIWGGSYTIQSGDFLQYDVWISSTSPAIQAAVDLTMGDGTTMRDFNGQACHDFFNIHAHPGSDLKGFADDQWYSRTVQLTPLVSATNHTVSFATVAFEGDSTGDYQAYFKNIKIVNSSFATQVTIYDGTTHPYQPQIVGINQNYVVGLAGYTNLSVTNTTVYDKTGTWLSPAISIDAAKLVNTSLISWQTLIPTGLPTPTTTSGSTTPLVPTGTTLTVYTSIDNKATWQPAIYKNTIPDLMAGVNVAGRSLYVKAVLAIANPVPEISPIVTVLQTTVTSSWTQTKSDNITTAATQSDFNTGNYTGTGWNGYLSTSAYGLDNGVALAGYLETWDYGATVPAGESFYGSSSPTVTLNRKQAIFSSGTGADCRARIDSIGSHLASGSYSTNYQNFSAQISFSFTDVSHENACGLAFRTTNWGNSNDSYAYTAMMIVDKAGGGSSVVEISKGTNSTGAGGYTNLSSGSGTLPFNASAGTTYTMKLIVNGTSFKVYIDDVQYLSITDATYSAAGQVAFRYYNNTGSTQTATFDNFGIVALQPSGGVWSGTWDNGTGISVNAIGSVGNSVIFWQTDEPAGTSITCSTSIDGGSTWQPATNSTAIPNLGPGTSATGISVRIKFTLSSNYPSATPVLLGWTCWLTTQTSASGTRISPALAMSGIGRIGGSSIYWTAQNALSALYTDTFAGRTVTPAGLLGTASSGLAWTIQSNTHTYLGVSNGEGNAYYDSAGAGSGAFVATLGQKLTDTNTVYRFNFLSIATTAITNTYVRYTASNNYYQAQLTGPGVLTLFKNVAGTGTTLATANITITANTYYWIRTQIESSTFSVKVWQDGTTEPTAWNLQVTDTSIASAGYAGLGATVAATSAGNGINFDGFTTSNVNLGVDVSFDGATWTDATLTTNNSIPVALIYPQPDPVLDFYSVDSSANYTSTNGTGGNTATWTWDTTNARLIGTQASGIRGLLLYTSFVSGHADIQVEADVNTSDTGSLILRASDVNHYYFLQIRDASSASSPNTLSLRKMVSGTTTTLATGTIAFTRGDFHHFRFSAIGSTLTGYMDNAQIVQITDTSFTSAGQSGFVCGSTTGNSIQIYSVRIQNLGDIHDGQSLYTRTRLSTTDPQNTPQLLDMTLSVRNSTIGTGLYPVASTNYAGIGNQQSVAQALDDLAKQSSTSTNGPYAWQIDKTKALQFHHSRVVPAPFYIYSGGSGASISSGGTGGNIQWMPTQPVLSRPDTLYRNRQTIDGGFDSTTLIHEQKQGDGKTQSWSMKYPLASVPSITISIPSINLSNSPVTVGVLNQDTGKDFYWSAGNNVISQDLSEVPPGSQETIDFYYYGQVPVRVTLDNTGVENANATPNPTVSLPGTTTQAQMAAIDSTSGIVEAYETVNTLSKTDATALARARLQENGSLGRTFTWTTLSYGLAPGQLVLVAATEYSLTNLPMLVTSVTTTAQAAAVTGGVQYYYSISATETLQILGDWSVFFLSLSTGRRN